MRLDRINCDSILEIDATGRPLADKARNVIDWCFAEVTKMKAPLVSASREAAAGPGRMRDVRQAIGKGVRHHGTGGSVGRGRLGIRSRGASLVGCDVNVPRLKLRLKWFAPGGTMISLQPCI